MIKLSVVNAGKRPIVVTTSYVLPDGHWYVAPNATPITGKGRRELMYGKPAELPVNVHRHNVLVGRDSRHEFFVGPRDRDTKPTWCCVVTFWQPLGGLPIGRPPLVLFKNRSQIEELFLTRKGKQGS
jgi:hypothetical protein